MSENEVLPESVVQELSNKPPPTRALILDIIYSDQREALSLDDIVTKLYLLHDRILKRHTVSQHLYQLVRREQVDRPEWGRYSITPKGYEYLLSLGMRQRETGWRGDNV